MHHNRFLIPFFLFVFLPFLSSCGYFFAQTSDEPPTEKEYTIANTAIAQIGVPYKRGGTTPHGFDCSGLVLFCYQSQGIALPRQASDQADVGKNMALSSVHEGDILVFSTGFFSKHTAIYVGNGKFVHAPGVGRRVQLCSLNDSYWQDTLKSIRRIADE